MEIITGRTGIKHVRAADDARIYRMLFGSGDYVLQDGSQLVAAKTGSNQITVSDGFLMSQGRLAGIYADSGAETVQIDSGTAGSKRQDTINLIQIYKNHLVSQTFSGSCNAIQMLVATSTS